MPRRCRLVWRGGRGSCSWPLRGWLTVGSRRRWGSASPRWSPGGAATRPGGVRGLEDAPRSGCPRQVPRERGVAATLAPPPKRYGVTHWSSRLLARHLGIGNATVARVWRSLWDPALEVGDLQVLHRPRAGGQGHRRGGPVPGAPGQRRSAVRRREVPDPGPGPHRPDAAHAAGQDRGGAPTSTPGTEPPPCSPPWRSPPATSQPPASPATAVPSCSSSCTRSRVPTPTTSCGLLGVFRTVLVFLLQAAFFRSRKSRSTSFGARYPRAE